MSSSGSSGSNNNNNSAILSQSSFMLRGIEHPFDELSNACYSASSSFIGGISFPSNPSSSSSSSSSSGSSTSSLSTAGPLNLLYSSSAFDVSSVPHHLNIPSNFLSSQLQQNSQPSFIPLKGTPYFFSKIKLPNQAPLFSSITTTTSSSSLKNISLSNTETIEQQQQQAQNQVELYAFKPLLYTLAECDDAILLDALIHYPLLHGNKIDDSNQNIHFLYSLVGKTAPGDNSNDTTNTSPNSQKIDITSSSSSSIKSLSNDAKSSDYCYELSKLVENIILSSDNKSLISYLVGVKILLCSFRRSGTNRFGVSPSYPYILLSEQALIELGLNPSLHRRNKPQDNVTNSTGISGSGLKSSHGKSVHHPPSSFSTKRFRASGGGNQTNTRMSALSDDSLGSGTSSLTSKTTNTTSNTTEIGTSWVTSSSSATTAAASSTNQNQSNKGSNTGRLFFNNPSTYNKFIVPIYEVVRALLRLVARDATLQMEAIAYEDHMNSIATSLNSTNQKKKKQLSAIILEQTKANSQKETSPEKNHNMLGVFVHPLTFRLLNNILQDFSDLLKRFGLALSSIARNEGNTSGRSRKRKFRRYSAVLESSRFCLRVLASNLFFVKQLSIDPLSLGLGIPLSHEHNQMNFESQHIGGHLKKLIIGFMSNGDSSSHQDLQVLSLNEQSLDHLSVISLIKLHRYLADEAVSVWATGLNIFYPSHTLRHELLNGLLQALKKESGNNNNNTNNPNTTSGLPVWEKNTVMIERLCNALASNIEILETFVPVPLRRHISQIPSASSNNQELGFTFEEWKRSDVSWRDVPMFSSNKSISKSIDDLWEEENVSDTTETNDKNSSGEKCIIEIDTLSKSDIETRMKQLYLIMHELLDSINNAKSTPRVDPYITCTIYDSVLNGIPNLTSHNSFTNIRILGEDSIFKPTARSSQKSVTTDDEQLTEGDDDDRVAFGGTNASSSVGGDIEHLEGSIDDEDEGDNGDGEEEDDDHDEDGDDDDEDDGGWSYRSDERYYPFHQPSSSMISSQGISLGTNAVNQGVTFRYPRSVGTSSVTSSMVAQYDNSGPSEAVADSQSSSFHPNSIVIPPTSLVAHEETDSVSVTSGSAWGRSLGVELHGSVDEDASSTTQNMNAAGGDNSSQIAEGMQDEDQHTSITHLDNIYETGKKEEHGNEAGAISSAGSNNNSTLESLGIDFNDEDAILQQALAMSLIHSTSVNEQQQHQQSENVGAGDKKAEESSEVKQSATPSQERTASTATAESSIAHEIYKKESDVSIQTNDEKSSSNQDENTEQQHQQHVVIPAIGVTVPANLSTISFSLNDSITPSKSTPNAKLQQVSSSKRRTTIANVENKPLNFVDEIISTAFPDYEYTNTHRIRLLRLMQEMVVYSHTVPGIATLTEKINSNVSQGSEDANVDVYRTLEFNEVKTADSIEVIGNQASQRVDKTWGSALCKVPLTSEMQDIYRWCVQIDKCEKGHIFVGVATLEANTRTYLGGDKLGWGFIGTANIWHNHAKVGTYGEDFRTGDTVIVTLNAKEGTLSFGTQKKDFGVAFSRLKQYCSNGNALYPAIGMYQKGDKVTMKFEDSGAFSFSSSLSKTVHQPFGELIRLHQGRPVQKFDDIPIIDGMKATEKLLSKISQPPSSDFIKYIKILLKICKGNKIQRKENNSKVISNILLPILAQLSMWPQQYISAMTSLATMRDFAQSLTEILKDKVSSINSNESNIEQNNNSGNKLNHPVNGDWTFISSPPYDQRYGLSFRIDKELPKDEESSTIAIYGGPSSCLAVNQLGSSGSPVKSSDSILKLDDNEEIAIKPSSSFEVSCNGFAKRNRVVFLESWNNGSSLCVTDIILSPDKRMMFGHYLQGSDNKVGAIWAIKESDYESNAEDEDDNITSYVSHLIGKLSASLFYFVDEIPIFSESKSQSTDYSILDHFRNFFSPGLHEQILLDSLRKIFDSYYQRFDAATDWIQPFNIEIENLARKSNMNLKTPQNITILGKKREIPTYDEVFEQILNVGASSAEMSVFSEIDSFLSKRTGITPLLKMFLANKGDYVDPLRRVILSAFIYHADALNEYKRLALLMRNKVSKSLASTPSKILQQIHPTEKPLASVTSASSSFSSSSAFVSTNIEQNVPSTRELDSSNKPQEGSETPKQKPLKFYGKFDTSSESNNNMTSESPAPDASNDTSPEFDNPAIISTSSAIISSSSDIETRSQVASAAASHEKGLSSSVSALEASSMENPNDLSFPKLESAWRCARRVIETLMRLHRSELEKISIQMIDKSILSLQLSNARKPEVMVDGKYFSSYDESVLEECIRFLCDTNIEAENVKELLLKKSCFAVSRSIGMSYMMNVIEEFKELDKVNDNKSKSEVIFSSQYLINWILLCLKSGSLKELVESSRFWNKLGFGSWIGMGLPYSVSDPTILDIIVNETKSKIYPLFNLPNYDTTSPLDANSPSLILSDLTIMGIEKGYQQPTDNDILYTLPEIGTNNGGHYLHGLDGCGYLFEDELSSTFSKLYFTSLNWLQDTKSRNSIPSNILHLLGINLGIKVDIFESLVTFDMASLISDLMDNYPTWSNKSNLVVSSDSQLTPESSLDEGQISNLLAHRKRLGTGASSSLFDEQSSSQVTLICLSLLRVLMNHIVTTHRRLIKWKYLKVSGLYDNYLSQLLNMMFNQMEKEMEKSKHEKVEENKKDLFGSNDHLRSEVSLKLLMIISAASSRDTELLVSHFKRNPAWISLLLDIIFVHDVPFSLKYRSLRILTTVLPLLSPKQIELSEQLKEYFNGLNQNVKNNFTKVDDSELFILVLLSSVAACSSPTNMNEYLYPSLIKLGYETTQCFSSELVTLFRALVQKSENPTIYENEWQSLISSIIQRIVEKLAPATASSGSPLIVSDESDDGNTNKIDAFLDSILFSLLLTIGAFVEGKRVCSHVRASYHALQTMSSEIPTEVLPLVTGKGILGHPVEKKSVASLVFVYIDPEYNNNLSGDIDNESQSNSNEGSSSAQSNSSSSSSSSSKYASSSSNNRSPQPQSSGGRLALVVLNSHDLLSIPEKQIPFDFINHMSRLPLSSALYDMVFERIQHSISELSVKSLENAPTDTGSDFKSPKLSSTDAVSEKNEPSVSMDADKPITFVNDHFKAISGNIRVSLSSFASHLLSNPDTLKVFVADENPLREKVFIELLKQATDGTDRGNGLEDYAEMQNWWHVLLKSWASLYSPRQKMVSRISSMSLSSLASGFSAKQSEKRSFDGNHQNNATSTSEALIDAMMNLGLGLSREACRYALSRNNQVIENAVLYCIENPNEIEAINNAQASKNTSAELNAAKQRERQAAIAQLVEMGFSEALCNLALERCNNNIDNALHWILSNPDAALEVETPKVTTTTEQESTIATSETAATVAVTTTSETATGEIVQSEEEKANEELYNEMFMDDNQNPPVTLICVSGPSAIVFEGDNGLTISPSGKGETFSSIIANNILLESGKWYYEVELLSDNCVQMGWADACFSGNAAEGNGVGDDSHSWAYDGYRNLKWHIQSVTWGKAWKKGDICGCAIDIDSGEMWFSLNGDYQAPMGKAFYGLQKGRDFIRGLTPAISLSSSESVKFNFGRVQTKGKYPFVHHPPEHFRQSWKPIDSSLYSASNLRRPPQDELDIVSLSLLSNEKLSQNDFMEESLGLPSDERELQYKSNASSRKSSSSSKRNRSQHRSHSAPKAVAIEKDDGVLLSSYSSDDIETASKKLSSLRIEDIEAEILRTSVEMMKMQSRIGFYRLLLQSWMLLDENTKNSVSSVLIYDKESSGLRSEFMKLLKYIFLDCRSNLLQSIGIDLSTMKKHLSDKSKDQSLKYLATIENPNMIYLHCIIVDMFSICQKANIGKEFLSAITKMLQAEIHNLSAREFALVSVDDDAFSVRSNRTFPAQIKYTTEDAKEAKQDLFCDQLALSQPNMGYALWLTDILMQLILFDDQTRSSNISIVCDVVTSWLKGLESPGCNIKHVVIQVLNNILLTFSKSSFGDNNSLSLQNLLEPSTTRMKTLFAYMLKRVGTSSSTYNRFLRSIAEYICSSSLHINHQYKSSQFEKIVRNKQLGVLSSEPTLFTGRINRPMFGEAVEKEKKMQEDLEKAKNDFKFEIGKSVKKVDSSSSTLLKKGVIESIEKISDTILAITVKWEHAESDDKEKEIETFEVDQHDEDSDNPIEVIMLDADSSSGYLTYHNVIDKIEGAESKPKDSSSSSNPPKAIFGDAITYGVLLWLHLPSDDNFTSKMITGELEIPDMSAVVKVEGHFESDGDDIVITLKETEFVQGRMLFGWKVFFGNSDAWVPGTIYTLRANWEAFKRGCAIIQGSSILNVDSASDAASSISAFTQELTLEGKVELSSKRLFALSNFSHGPSIELERERVNSDDDLQEIRKVTLSSSSAFSSINESGLALGEIGFSRGVHYWEIKVNNASLEYGTIYVGVSERPSKDMYKVIDNDGNESKISNQRKGNANLMPNLNRWDRTPSAYGFVNFRATQCCIPSGLNESVYGEFFGTEDVVGVVLDMDLGEISYYIDGMKFGVHMLRYLGVGFNSRQIKGKSFSQWVPGDLVLYPAIGLRKYSGESVSLSSKYISFPSISENESAKNLCQVTRYLNDWPCVTVESKNENDEFIESSWNLYKKWKSNIWKQYPSRAGGRMVELNTSEEAIKEVTCKYPHLNVSANSLVRIVKSEHRALETPEVAQVLGVRQNRLWYRYYGTSSSFEANNSANESSTVVNATEEGSNWAWYWESDELSEITPIVSESVSAAVATSPSVGSMEREKNGTMFDRNWFINAAFSSKWTKQKDTRIVQELNEICTATGKPLCNLDWEALDKLFNMIHIGEEYSIENRNHVMELEEIKARAAVLRLLNSMIDLALPYINFDEYADSPYLGASSVEQIAVTSLGLSINSKISTIFLQARDLLLFETKKTYYQKVTKETSSTISLSQDEYDDPPDLKTVNINRIRATPERLAELNVTKRHKRSVFGQLYAELSRSSDSTFRRVYIGKGHGNQARAFKVKFVGEGVNDYGGPYRAVLEQALEELQYDMFNENTKSRLCLLSFLVPTPNRASSTGSNGRDKFLFNPNAKSPSLLRRLEFLGKLIGMCLRGDIQKGVNFPLAVWKQILGLPVVIDDLEEIDSSFVQDMRNMMDLAKSVKDDHELVEEMGIDRYFVITLSDGTNVSLVENGHQIPVKKTNIEEFVKLAIEKRINESNLQLSVFKKGLFGVIPYSSLAMFSPRELRDLICGNEGVNVELLKTITVFDEGIRKQTREYLWESLSMMSESERSAFLQFVWARSKLPPRVLLQGEAKMKVQLSHSESARMDPDTYLPSAQTCFFTLQLPNYSSLQVMHKKLLSAIECTLMDADVRLRNAEGWD